MRLMNSELIQEAHYDKIAASYEAHYSDECSQQYRVRFIYDPMLEGVDLRGKTVLEGLCGSGQTTGYLLSRGARVTGLDISKEEIASFRLRWPQCEARAASILDSGFASDSFDCIVVVGGLHHLHPRLNDAVREIHRILKPGGHFCFAEPHSRALPDLVRRYWYRRDPLFANNEKAIDVDELKDQFSARFKFKRETYLGNIGYLLVLNSMVFRIPLSLKPVYTPVLMPLESVINRIQGKLFSCFVVTQWQKL
jgi:SAM-dependent methyltransferase